MQLLPNSECRLRFTHKGSTHRTKDRNDELVLTSLETSAEVVCGIPIIYLNVMQVVIIGTNNEISVMTQCN